MAELEKGKNLPTPIGKDNTPKTGALEKGRITASDNMMQETEKTAQAESSKYKEKTTCVTPPAKRGENMSSTPVTRSKSKQTVNTLGKSQKRTSLQKGKSRGNDQVKSASKKMKTKGSSSAVNETSKQSPSGKRVRAKGTTKSAKGLTWIPGFRSNIHSLSTVLSGIVLTDRHLNKLKTSPFFNLFNAIKANSDVNHRKMDSTIEDIISCYNPEEHKFLLGKVLVPLTASDVSAVFGVVSGKEKVDMKKKRERCSIGIVERLFQNCNAKEITMKRVKDTLRRIITSEREEDIGDVVRLLNLIAFGSVFFASKGETMSPGFLYYVDDLDKMKSYDWATAIVDNLIQSLDKNYKTPLLVVGCVSILPYWFNEHTMLYDATRDLLPRFMKWDVSKRKEKFREVITKLRRDQVIVEELNLSKDEEVMLMSRNDGYQTEIAENERAVGDEGEINGNNAGDEERNDNRVMETEGGGLSELNSFVNDDVVLMMDDLLTPTKANKGSTSLGMVIGGVVNTVNEDLIKERDCLMKERDGLKKEIDEERRENERLRNENADLLAKNEQIERNAKNALDEGQVFFASEVETRKFFEKEIAKKNQEIAEKDKEINEMKCRYEKVIVTVEGLASRKKEETAKVQTIQDKSAREMKNLDDNLAAKEKQLEKKVLEGGQFENKLDANVPVKVRGKSVPPVGSIEKRIKERGGKRKQKEDPEFTYDGKKKRKQVSKKEGDKNESGGEELVASKMVLDVDDLEESNLFLPPFNKNFSLTTLSLDEATITKFKNLCGKLATPDSVWYVPGLHVNMWHMWELAHDRMTEASVMDAYLRILKERYTELPGTSGGSQRQKVNFVSSCASRWLKANDSEEIKRGIDEVIKQFVREGTDFILFPIHSSSNDRGGRTMDHWTLLVLDTGNGEYTFYNSLKRNNRKDHYATHGRLLFDHVRARFKGIEATQKDVATFIELKRENMPQQKDGSLDCGIIVLMEAEEMFQKGSVSKKYEAAAASSYRAKMFRDILHHKDCPYNT